MPTDESSPTAQAGDGAGARRPGRRVYLIAAAALVTAAVLLALVLGAFSGHHASNSSPSATAGGVGQAGVRAAASYLGMPPAQLRRELRSGRTLAQIASSTPGRSAAGLEQTITQARAAALAAAVSSGRLSSAREKTLLADLHKQTAAEVQHRRVNGGAAGAVPITASYLGLAPGQVRREEAEGRSLAQIADATPGRSASGLTARIIAVERIRIARQARSGRITQAAERQLLASLEQRVTTRVNAAPKTAKG